MKRAIDIFCSACGLVILSPLLLVISTLIWWKMGRPILFRQTRPGLHGEPFEMLKFRTMREETDSAGQPLADSERLTGLGRFLRASSLDELPELWNVLKGDMSLVGPRPLLMQYLDRYTPEQARRHEVRPGMTGWAQVNGRNAISWDEKFALDTWYVDNASLWLDVKILCLTVWHVIARKGISANDHATMPEFKGPEFLGPETKASSEA